MAATHAAAAQYSSGSRGPDILGAIISTYCISILAIGLRTAARQLSNAGFWVDDWLIYAGTVLYTAVLAVFVETVRLGAGRHIQTVDPAVFERIEILFYSTEIAFPWAMGLVKCSVLAFYWRIFNVASIRRPIFVVATAVFAWALSFTFATIFQCIPAQKLWKLNIPGHCVSKYKYFLGTAIPEVVTDFVILAMPLPYIWSLQMKPKQKLLLTIVFVLGGFASVSSILRLWAFVTRDYSSPDLTYTTTNPAIWSCVEASIAITSACLPSLRPVFAAMGSTYSKLKTRHSRSRPSSSGRTEFSRIRPKSSSGVPRYRQESLETSDKVKFHHAPNLHPMTNHFVPLDLPVKPERSLSRSDELWPSHSEVSQDWAYPAPLNIRKGADHV